MKKLGKVIISLVASFVMLAGIPLAQPATPAYAENEVPVSINPATITVDAGDDFTVNVDIGTVTDFNGAEYSLYFNPAVVSVDNITEGNIGGTTIPVAFNKVQDGYYRIEHDLFGYDPPYVGGSGYLCTIHFHAIQDGASVVDLQDVILSDWVIPSVPAVVTDGLINVGGVTTIAVTPPKTEIGVGKDFSVNLAISDVTELSAMQYDVTFNPAIISLTDITSGNVGGTLIPANIIDSANEVAAGHWRVAQVLAPGASENLTANGTGYLSTLHFHATAIGTSSINLTDGILSNFSSNLIPSGWISGSANVTENFANVIGLTISPLNQTITTGQNQVYSATAFYDDDTSQDVTNAALWTSSNTNIATITGPGQVSATTTPGTTTITASFDTSSNSTLLTTIKAPLVSINVTPGSQSLAPGLTQQYTATGTFGDTSQEDITGSVQWASSNTNVASISASGLATALTTGSTDITAQMDEITSSPVATLTVINIATVQVNFGQSIKLGVGGDVPASTTSGIPISVNNLPNFSVPDNGLASIQLNIDWDPSVINVTSRYISSTASTYFEQKQLGSMATPGHTSMGFSKSSNYENFPDMVLAYFGIEAVGEIGDSTTLDVSVVLLEDGSIPPNPVNNLDVDAPVTIVNVLADASLAEDRYDDMFTPYAVVNVNIDQIKDVAGNAVEIPGGLGSFSAQITTTGDGISVARVLGTPGFESLSYNSETGVFSVSGLTSAIQPNNTPVAQIFVQLTGSSNAEQTMSVVFTSVTAANDPSNIPVNGDSNLSMAFRRGDANGDGQILFNDCLYAARASVDTLDPPLVKLINAACPLNDGASGSIVRINDVLYIARRAVDTLTEYYTLYP